MTGWIERRLPGEMYGGSRSPLRNWECPVPHCLKTHRDTKAGRRGPLACPDHPSVQMVSAR